MKDTELKLKYWRGGQTQAERLAANILNLESFTSIDPQCPLGGPDGLKDILCEKDGVKYIGAAYFPSTEKQYKEIKNKFIHDLDGVVTNKVDGLVFLTNQALTPSERTSLIQVASGKNHKSVIYHLERISSILDSPLGYGARLEYLGLEMSREEQLSFFSQWNQSFKEQQKDVQEAMSGMQADIRAMQSPLLPCSLFYTLKFTCPVERLRLVFEGRQGWMKYKDGSTILTPAGLVEIHSACNPIEMKVHESRCSISEEEAEQLGQEGPVVLMPVSVSIELFFGQTSDISSQASLILCTSPKTQTISSVKGLELFDRTVFQNVVCKNLSVQNSSRHSWSTTDLCDSYLRVTLEFFFIRSINDIAKEDWPSLHNLQLVIGPKIEHILAFNLEQLTKQVVRNSPNPLAKGDAEFIQIVFEFAIDKQIYKNNLYTTLSHGS